METYPRIHAFRPLVAVLCLATAAFGQSPSSTAKSASEDPPKRSEAYYNLTMGHIYEQRYESTSQDEDASRAIEFFKKAYALDPSSPVIGERLAEIYWKSQRIHDAVTEAQEILKRDPGNLSVRRLLARIYVRWLGDLSSAAKQSETVQRATEQLREIVRLDPGDAESALWLARLYRLQNEPEKAGEILRGLLKHDPENEAGVEQLTQLLMDQGKSREAIAFLEGIVKRSPSPGLLDLLGDAYAQGKDAARAEQVYRQAVELEPGEASHRRGLGSALFAQGKYPEARKEYDKLAELEPDDPEVYLRLAQIYREMHQLDRAEENLLKARQHAPGNLEVIYNEAMLYETQGRFEDAIRVLSDAVTGVKAQAAAMPSSRRTLGILYQQLGRLYREVENYDAAIFTFQEMLKLGDEEDRRARFLIIDTYRAAKDLPRALEEMRKARERYPSDTSLRVTQALLLGEKGDTEAGVQLLRGLLNGSDSDREIHLEIAQVYERGRRFAEAEAAARAAEKISGTPRDNEMVWFLLGAIYERQKLYDRAEREFQRALGVNPRNAAVLNYYGYMLGDLGIRLEEARALVQRALDEEPNNGAYLDSMGWVFFRQNRFREAEEMLRRAAQRESRDPTIHSHLGDVYYKTGRSDLAAAEWEKSLAEWRRALPTEHEADKIAEIEKKLANARRQLAQKKNDGAASKPE